MASEAEVGKKKATRGRSPNYPGIDLRQAIDRARAFYAQDRRNETPAAMVLKHWGYQPKSGGGLVVLAALKKFGLLHDQGEGEKRTVKLTPTALDIIEDPREDSPERDQLIRAAALLPPIHKELWEKYGGEFPSDTTFKWQLMKDRSFTDGGAEEFISQFKRTIAFANLTKSGVLPAEHGDNPADGEDDAGDPLVKPIPAILELDPKRPAAQAASTQTVIPLAITHNPASWARLAAHFPLSEDEWEMMMNLLQAMKPRLVKDEKPGVARESTD